MHQRQDHVCQDLLPRCHRRRTILLLFMLVLWSGILLHGIGTAQPTRFEIGLIGDLPYSEEDEAKFPNLMQAMNEANLAFVVHVGDIENDLRGYQRTKSGMRPCTDKAF